MTSSVKSPKEILQKAETMELRLDRCSAVLAQILFDDSINEQNVFSHAPLLKLFLTNEKNQIAFLGGIERLIGDTFKKLIPHIGSILKWMYDADLVDEEVFFVWGTKVSKKYVDKNTSKELRLKAQPFLTWLKEAESEEESEEE